MKCESCGPYDIQSASEKLLGDNQFVGKQWEASNGFCSFIDNEEDDAGDGCFVYWWVCSHHQLMDNTIT